MPDLDSTDIADPAARAETADRDGRRGVRGGFTPAGLLVLCCVYAVVGAALLWYRGTVPLRALLIAGVWAVATIIGALLVLRPRMGAPGPGRTGALPGTRPRTGPPRVGRAAAFVHLSLLVAVVVAVAAWPLIRSAEWGTPRERVTSPDGRHAVVTYHWRAMIDPGWNIGIERADGSGRQWFWRGTESPAPVEVRFAGQHRVEMVDDYGQTWVVDFDPETLEPSDRYCPNPAYCYQWPWDTYTRTTPAP